MIALHNVCNCPRRTAHSTEKGWLKLAMSETGIVKCTWHLLTCFVKFMIFQMCQQASRPCDEVVAKALPSVIMQPP